MILRELIDLIEIFPDEKREEIFRAIPGATIVKIVSNMGAYLDSAWEEIPEEDKKEFARNLIKLAMKGAAVAA